MLIKNVKRLFNLSTLLASSFAIFAVAAAGLIAFLLFLNFREQIREDFRIRLLNIAGMAALMQDGDNHAQLNEPTDVYTELYTNLNNRNFEIIAIDKQIRYIYTMRQEQNGSIYFVLDAGYDPSSTGSYIPSEIGILYESPSELLAENFATLDNPIVEREFYVDEYGTFLSAYAPFYSSDGSREGIIGVDFTADYVLSQERRVFRSAVILFIFMTPVFLFVGWILGKTIGKPLVSLTESAQQISEGKFNQRINIDSIIPETRSLVDAFNSMADYIGNLFTDLEYQKSALSKQTQDLDKLSTNMERRATQLQAIAEVASAIASLQDIKELLPKITSVISAKFQYYHVGVFLVDDSKEFAVLSAANSEGGLRMVARGHKLKVGETGIVGYAIAAKTPRVSLDTASDTVHYKNPDLPDTRSEIALPLIAGDQVIGALDVQSTEFNAFSNEDIEVLSALASQVSIAIENSRLYDETRRSLVEVETLYRQFLRKEWGRLIREKKHIGYRKSIYGASPLEKPLDWPELNKAKELGETLVITHEIANNSEALAIPLKIRNEVIGVLDFRYPTEHKWTKDQVELVQSIADRVSLAIENARLFEETSSRAERERIVAGITNKIRSTNDPTSMISIALDELKTALGASRVQIRPYENSNSRRTIDTQNNNGEDVGR